MAFCEEGGGFEDIFAPLHFFLLFSFKLVQLNNIVIITNLKKITYNSVILNWLKIKSHLFLIIILF